MKIRIVVNLRIEGIHSWPNAHKSVAFLKEPHRHIFHITAKKSVAHEDREIEIITLKRQIQNGLIKGGINFGTASCESIATLILKNYDLDYCQVLEDGENGAEVYV